MFLLIWFYCTLRGFGQCNASGISTAKVSGKYIDLIYKTNL